MDLITICDTETTGFKNSDLVIEVAMILYSLVHAAPVATFATLIPRPSNSSTSRISGLTAEEVHGIPQELLDKAAVINQTMAATVMSDMLCCSKAVLAHGAPFDKRMLKSSKVFGPELLNETPWICTMDNIKWPKKYSSKSLTSIALAHGVPVVTAHRALADCDIIARLLTKLHECGHDLVRLIEEAMEPHILVQALVEKPGSEAKAAQFYFEGPTKRWLKTVKESEFKAGTLGFSFRCIPAVASPDHE